MPPVPGLRVPVREMARTPLTARNARNLAGMIASLPWPPNAAVLVRNAASLRRDAPWAGSVQRDREGLLPLAEAALGWIAHSQDRVGSGGVGDFRFQGWTPGYPEVTGYIVPTMFDWAELLSRPELADRAIRMASWELGIQQPSGGWESWYEGEGRPPVVFNTGQVIRGLVRTATETGEDRYLDAAIRAGDWIIAGQEPDGSFSKGNYLEMRRVYDVYSTASLAQLAEASGEERFASAAAANAEFAISQQTADGWFDLCDNVPDGNERPSTHTLGYTADGLIEIGLLQSEPRFVAAGELTARSLLAAMEPGGRLPGRFDRDWNPAADYVVMTGSAQLGILLAGMHARASDPDPELRAGCWELLDFLAWAQRLNSVGANRRGAIAGSYPVWGRYVPLKYPSWATKFYLDQIALLLGAITPSSA